MQNLLEMLNRKSQQEQEPMITPMAPQMPEMEPQVDDLAEQASMIQDTPQPSQAAMQAAEQTRAEDAAAIQDFTEAPLMQRPVEMGEGREVPFAPGKEDASMISEETQVESQEKIEQSTDEELDKKEKDTKGQQEDVGKLPEGPAKEAAKSKLELLMEQIQAERERREKEVASGRSTDNIRELISGITTSLNQVSAGNAMHRSGAQGLTPIAGLNLAPRMEAAASRDADSRLGNLMRELQATQRGSGQTGRIFQTRTGLVQLGEDGTPQEIYRDPTVEQQLDLSKSRLGVTQERLGLGKDREGRLREKFDYTKEQKFEDDARNALKDTLGLEEYKKGIATISEIPTIRVLLDDAYEKGGQSLAMLGPKVAKGIAGEVGVLTEADVTRYVKNPEVVGGLLDSLEKAKSGQITKASYENLKRLLDISETEAQRKIDVAMDKGATLFARREKIPYEDARALIDSSFQKEVNDQAQEKVAKNVEYSSAQEKGIEAVMKKNKISRTEAIKALVAAGKL